ncbi:MAG: M48 family metallopeptidase [Candidatus Methanoperedens sp.]|nr:M48 family metallopeptidase [Candidatus Methanoperedens sp.]
MYIDESGDLGLHGSKYLVLSALLVDNPVDLEFKTGRLLLVLPKSYKGGDGIIEKHKDWISKRNSEIKAALEKAQNKKLNLKRTDDEFRQLIFSIVENISDSLKININDIYFRKMKSKWGSCSSKKDLTINTLLRYLPDSLIEYVIFHEMVHLIERKHNKRFWDFISNKFNNYNDKEKEQQKVHEGLFILAVLF